MHKVRRKKKKKNTETQWLWKLKADGGRNQRDREKKRGNYKPHACPAVVHQQRGKEKGRRKKIQKKRKKKKEGVLPRRSIPGQSLSAQRACESVAVEKCARTRVRIRPRKMPRQRESISAMVAEPEPVFGLRATIARKRSPVCVRVLVLVGVASLAPFAVTAQSWPSPRQVDPPTAEPVRTHQMSFLLSTNAESVVWYTHTHTCRSLASKSLCWCKIV